MRKKTYLSPCDSLGQGQRTGGDAQVLQLVLLVHQLGGHPLFGGRGLHPAELQLLPGLHHPHRVPGRLLPSLPRGPIRLHHQARRWQRLHRHVQDPGLRMLLPETGRAQPASVRAGCVLREPLVILFFFRACRAER